MEWETNWSIDNVGSTTYNVVIYFQEADQRTNPGVVTPVTMTTVQQVTGVAVVTAGAVLLVSITTLGTPTGTTTPGSGEGGVGLTTTETSTTTETGTTTTGTTTGRGGTAGTPPRGPGARTVPPPGTGAPSHVTGGAPAHVTVTRRAGRRSGVAGWRSRTRPPWMSWTIQIIKYPSQ